jgi:LuxR family maltose regulon positive regulatory protein
LGDQRKLPIAGSAYIGIALVEREWNNLEVAETLLMDSYELCNLFGNPRPWHMALAQVLSAQGKIFDAFNEIQKATQMETGTDVPFDYLDIDILQVNLWLSPIGGNIPEAVRWAEDSGLKADDTPSFSQRIAYTNLARVLIAQGELEKAYGLLVRLEKDAENGGRKGELIAILALQSLSLHSLGEGDQAISTLERALTLAEPEGLVRIFVDEGPPMARLLYEAISRGIASDYIYRLLGAFPDAEPVQIEPLKSHDSTIELIEHLSEREIEILQLIAEGLTNQEIASKLYLSLNTVKAHNRNIYSKLSVSNRTQAVSKSRSLGILPST